MSVACWVTYFRIALVPVAVASLMGSGHRAFLVAAALCAIAGLSDILDGHLARRRCEVSLAGARLDLLADKLLILGMLCALVLQHLVSVWVLAVVAGREMVVTALRLRVAWVSSLSPSDALGKAKMATSVIAIVGLLLAEDVRRGGPLSPVPFAAELFSLAWWVLIVAVALTVLSGVNYLARAFAGPSRRLSSGHPCQRARRSNEEQALARSVVA